MKELMFADQAVAEVKAGVERAVWNGEEANRFMVAAWWIDKDGELKMERVTWKFPTDKMPDAVEMLRANLQPESGIDKTPLPLADFLLRPDMVVRPEDQAIPMPALPTAAEAFEQIQVEEINEKFNEAEPGNVDEGGTDAEMD